MFAAIALVISGCENEPSVTPDNSISNLSLKIVTGNDQKGIYNEQLQDSIVVKVINLKGNAVPKIEVSFRISEGDGDVTSDWVLTDSLGQAYSKWSIGCFSNYNEVTVYLLDSISN